MPTPDGKSYWLVAGDASFYGTVIGHHWFPGDNPNLPRYAGWGLSTQAHMLGVTAACPWTMLPFTAKDEVLDVAGLACHGFSRNVRIVTTYDFP